MVDWNSGISVALLEASQRYWAWLSDTFARTVISAETDLSAERITELIWRREGYIYFFGGCISEKRSAGGCILISLIKRRLIWLREKAKAKQTQSRAKHSRAEQRQPQMSPRRRR